MSVMFSTLFKRLRIDKDLHQREAAEKLGVTQATVSRWECDKGLPMRATESAICELLGIERQTLRESIEESARRGVAATDNEKQRSLDRLMKIPILGSAAAGTPRERKGWRS